MPFKKGDKKVSGRVKGTPNKATGSIREKFDQLLASYTAEQMAKDLKAIKRPENRLNIILGLSEYVIPKLARTEIDAGENAKVKFTVSVTRAGN